MYAYSIEKGRYFDDYSGYETSNWNVSQPEFEGKCFDAIVCAHFVEHIQDPESLVLWAARKLRKGGRIYLEWPSSNSLSLPSRKELEKLGVPLIISRFDDDGTHQALPDGDAIANALRSSGFAIESRGIVRLPWLEDELLGHHKDSEDGFYRQAAVVYRVVAIHRRRVASQHGAVRSGPTTRNPGEPGSRREVPAGRRRRPVAGGSRWARGA